MAQVHGHRRYLQIHAMNNRHWVLVILGQCHCSMHGPAKALKQTGTFLAIAQGQGASTMACLFAGYALHVWADSWATYIGSFQTMTMQLQHVCAWESIRTMRNMCCQGGRQAAGDFPGDGSLHPGYHEPIHPGYLLHPGYLTQSYILVTFGQPHIHASWGISFLQQWLHFVACRDWSEGPKSCTWPWSPSKISNIIYLFWKTVQIQLSNCNN